jgi:hypothetical protein
MKLKTLAIAAATLAVGAITSQAQSPVYSQNVVGYVVTITPANQYVLYCNPLTTGNDALTNVFHGQPGGTQLYYWNGNGWNNYTYSAAGGGHWKLGASTIVDNTNLPPGAGYFMFNSTTAFTNTYAGQIVPNSGASVTNPVPTNYNPYGAIIPYGDKPTNSATFNLQCAGGAQMQLWNVSLQKYDLFTYNAPSKSWRGATVTNPVINVAQGFFLSPGTATNWVQTLQ